jgi:hypothetical protein
VGVFVVPELDRKAWPTLGPQVCDLIEERAVFGPGSLKGQPAVLDDEKRAAIYKAYELYPRRSRTGKPGSRRFRRVRFSWRKGTAKTELMAWIAFAELHPEGPVRFDGWDADGQPVGRPVRDPYIPLLAYTSEQVQELAYGALMVVCQEGPDADLFDAGLERILRLDARGRADGKAVPLAQSPNARDGARTTFQGYDETHRLTLPRHVAAYTTMEANLPKRPLDDPWSLGITTAGVPGGGSVAELDKDEAEAIARGEVDEPELFYFHREAGPNHDLTSMEGRIEAIREASGPAVAAWSDLRGIAKQWDRPNADHRYLERTWLNRWTQSDAQAFDAATWETLAAPRTLPTGTAVAVGFDGSRWKDTTALILTCMETGHQVRRGLWVPTEAEPVDPVEVDQVVDDVFSTFDVARLYGDPAQGWDEQLAKWSGKYGPKRVAFFYTDSRNLRRTATMCRAYATAIRTGALTHDGDEDFERHIAAAQKRDIRMTDEDGTPLWVMEKERHDSLKKIDLAMAGALSWQARLDAMAAGSTPTDEYAYVM